MRVVYIGGEAVEVSDEVYSAFHSCERKLRTVVEKDKRNGLLWYHDRQYYEPADERESPEAAIIRREAAARLGSAMSELEDGERDLLEALYFDRVRLSVLARRTGVAYRTLGCRRDAALLKLRRKMDDGSSASIVHR